VSDTPGEDTSRLSALECDALRREVESVLRDFGARDGESLWALVFSQATRREWAERESARLREALSELGHHTCDQATGLPKGCKVCAALNATTPGEDTEAQPAPGVERDSPPFTPGALRELERRGYHRENRHPIRGPGDPGYRYAVAQPTPGERTEIADLPAPAPIGAETAQRIDREARAAVDALDRATRGMEGVEGTIRGEYTEAQPDDARECDHPDCEVLVRSPFLSCVAHGLKRPLAVWSGRIETRPAHQCSCGISGRLPRCEEVATHVFLLDGDETYCCDGHVRSALAGDTEAQPARERWFCGKCGRAYWSSDAEVKVEPYRACPECGEAEDVFTREDVVLGWLDGVGELEDRDPHTIETRALVEALDCGRARLADRDQSVMRSPESPVLDEDAWNALVEIGGLNFTVNTTEQTATVTLSRELHLRILRMTRTARQKDA